MCCFAFTVLDIVLSHLFSWMSSWDHHHFAKGDGFINRTMSYIMSIITLLSRRRWDLASCVVCIGLGQGITCMFSNNFMANFSQSVMQKLCLGGRLISLGVFMQSIKIGK